MSGLRKLINKTNVINWIFILFALAGFVQLSFYILWGYVIDFNSDSATANILAREQMVSKSLYPSTWYYGNELVTVSIGLLIHAVRLFVNDEMLCRGIAVLIQTFFLLAVLVWFCRKKLNSNCFYLAIPAFISGGSFLFLFNMFGQAYYGTMFLLNLITIGIALSVAEDKKINYKAMLAMGIFVVLQMVDGIRALIYLCVPLAVSMILFFIIENWNLEWRLCKDECLKYIKFLMALVLSALAGFVIQRKLACICNLAPGAVLSILYGHNGIDNIKNNFLNIIIGTVSFFGYKGDIGLFSMKGICSLASICFAAMITIIIPLIILRQYKKMSIFVKRGIVFYWISWIMIMIILLFSSIMITYAEIRYLLLPYCFAIIISCYYVYERLINTNLFARQIIGAAGVILFVALSIYQTHDYLNEYKLVRQHNENIVVALEEKDLKKGYATYWNSNKYTVESNFQFEIGALSADLVTPFRCLTTERYYSGEYEGETFLMLTQDEYEEKGMQFIDETYGKPEYSYNIEEYVIFVFDYDIAAKFNNP